MGCELIDQSSLLSIAIFIFACVPTFKSLRMSSLPSKATRTGKPIANKNGSDLYQSNRSPPKSLLRNNKALFRDITNGTRFWDAEETNFDPDFVSIVSTLTEFTVGKDKLCYYRPDPKIKDALAPRWAVSLYVSVLRGEDKGHTKQVFISMLGENTETGKGRKTNWAVLSNINTVTVPEQQKEKDGNEYCYFCETSYRSSALDNKEATEEEEEEEEKEEEEAEETA